MLGMKAQPHRKRWLAVLLLVGLVGQTAVAASHSILPVGSGIPHEHPADQGERDEHDPTSCSLCRIAPAFAHGLFVSPLTLPIDAGSTRRSIDAVDVIPGRTPWSTPASRAPPSPPNA